jgi:carboxypeptidase C (cathepsin A)
MKRLGLLLSCIVVFTTPAVIAADADSKEDAVSPMSVTEHNGIFNGKRLKYRAIAGETVLKNAKGEPEAAIFSTSYIATNPSNGPRPVSFIYNGGPGSSSVWLHMGVFGPKKVVLPSDAEDDGAAPFEIVDNPQAPLDVTDLVFIDPVGTGFSRPLGETEAKAFWGVSEDAKSVARFIRAWLREHNRWNSPKFIGGESYGTTRTAALVNELEGRFDDVSVNGLLLISTILDFSLDAYDPGNELVHMVALPTMAATAHYHGKAGQGVPLEEWVEQARQFALREYAPALLLGSRLEQPRYGEIRAKLAAFTGLSEDYLDRANLRVSYPRFNRELLRDEGVSLGRLDSRFKGEEEDGVGETPETDPSFYGIDGAYTAAINHWLRDGLKFNPDREYTIIGGVNSWNWKLSEQMWRQAYLNVTPYIGKAMRGNKHLRVFNAAGYYDFATPFMGAEYALDRAGVDQSRVDYKYYEAGHMMYIHHPSFDQFLEDVRNFIQAK